MENSEIEESWDNFNYSNYMRLKQVEGLETLNRDEELFKVGYMRGYKMAIQKVHSINRFEVINHTLTGECRAYIQRGYMEVEIELQDNNKTIKVFIQ